MRARVEALLRRKAGPSSDETVLRVHGLELNLVRRRATLHGRVLDLQPTEPTTPSDSGTENKKVVSTLRSHD